MPRGKPGNPYIHKDPLKEATDAVYHAVRNIAMVSISPRVAERIAERAVRAYLTARGENNFGNRMKPSTLRLYEMEVGDIIEVEATCKANLHGQFKTIRQKTGNDQLKWKCEQISPGKWRVERRENGTSQMFKRPYHNPKAVFLAEIPVGEWRPFPLAKEPNRINTDFTKNKARAILEDNNADWRARTREGVVEITRIR
jgi:hypothetical protein